MQKYRISKLAEQDLIDIWNYTLDNWSQDQATTYVSGLLNAFAKIAISPDQLGRSYEHVRSGYRKYPYGHHVIFYLIQPDGLPLISRVLHERMDFDRHL